MIPEPDKPPRQGMPPLCWLASLLLHVLLLGWLVFLSPVRIVNRAPKPAAATPDISPARAAQVMEKVSERQARTLSEDVRALEETRRELAAIEARKRDELRATSPLASASIERISVAQANARKAQIEAGAALAKTDAPDDPAITNLIAAIREAQTGADRFQSEALEALAMADPKFEPAYQAQAAANAVQSRAAQSLSEAEGQLSGATVLRARNAPKGNDLEEARKMLRSAGSQLASALSNAVVLSNSLPQLAAQAGTAKTDYAAAQAGGDKARVAAAKKRDSDARKAVENAQKNLARAQADIPKFQQRITEQTARVAKFSGKSGPSGTNPDTLHREGLEKLREARRLQTEAVSAQEHAVRMFADTRNGGTAPAAPPVPQAADLAQLYQAAVRTETELTETYRRLRAADLAMQRQIPLARALALTDVARPARPDLADALKNPQGGAIVADQRQAMLDARLQITAMRALAGSMLAQARGSGAGADGRQALEQLAAEDESQRAKDLTGAMKGGPGSGSGKPGSGRGSAAGTGNGGGSASTAGSGSPGTGSGGSGPGGGASGSGPGLGRGGDGTGSGPPPVQKDLAAVPGRVIGPGAVPGRWMFVDSWYLLGPFDNTGRANIEKQFPPETVVDLNATYVGKRGRPVRWDFFQSPQPRVVPPFDNFNPLSDGRTDGGDTFKARDLEYVIYYGYTELRAVEACDVWIAVGSDDFSKLWIEDQLVWASGKQQKKWRVDEGLRKVRLKQGINRVLFRVENGHAQTEFSLAVCAQ